MVQYRQDLWANSRLRWFCCKFKQLSWFPAIRKLVNYHWPCYLGSFMGRDRVCTTPCRQHHTNASSLARLYVNGSQFELYSARLVSQMQLQILAFLIFYKYLSVPNFALSRRSSLNRLHPTILLRCCSALSWDDSVEAIWELPGTVREAYLEEFAQFQGHVTAPACFRPWRKYVFCAVRYPLWSGASKLDYLFLCYSSACREFFL